MVDPSFQPSHRRCGRNGFRPRVGPAWHSYITHRWRALRWRLLMAMARGGSRRWRRMAAAHGGCIQRWWRRCSLHSSSLRVESSRTEHQSPKQKINGKFVTMATHSIYRSPATNQPSVHIKLRIQICAAHTSRSQQSVSRRAPSM